MNFGFIFPYSELYIWGGIALATLAVIALVFVRLERKRIGRLSEFIELKLAPRLLLGTNETYRRPLLWLTILGFTFMAATFFQPHWGQSLVQKSHLSHDVLVVLDVSQSMLAENPMPNRLQRAKQKIASIVEKSKGDRFALIAFSGAAELMCPFTLDHGYFVTVLNAVDTDSISYEGTNIGNALELAIATFQDQDDESTEDLSKSRAVLLISDGEEGLADNAEVDLDQLTAKIGSLARMFVMGVGDPRGTEITFSSGLGMRNRLPQGNAPHISKLDEATLSKLALDANGGYIRTSPSNSDVDEMFGLIQQLFAKDLKDDISDRLVNRYQWPLAAAILCFFAEGAWLVLLPFFRKKSEEYPTEAAEESLHA